MDVFGPIGLQSGSGEVQSARARASALEAQAKLAEAGSDKAKLRAAAEEFEQIFLQTMLSTMMEGTTPEAPFNGGAGEQQWQGFLTQEYAGALARNGGIGLADSIYEDLLALQEGR